jgi:hypothetical protein
MIGRRVAVVLVGISLAFILQGALDYILETHTKTGKLGLKVIYYSRTMTDQEIARAIGEDPFRALRRASLMLDAVVPAVGLVVGMLVACFERRMPGRLTVLALAPLLCVNFRHVAFGTALPRAELALKVLRESGMDAAYLALAVLTSVGVARLFSRLSGSVSPRVKA